MAEASFIAALAELFASGYGLSAFLGLFALVVAYRIAKGASIKEVFGFTNGYLREKEYRNDMADLKTLVNQHHDSESKRMDNHSRELGELRSAVQDIDRKVTKVQTKVEMMEQYKD